MSKPSEIVRTIFHLLLIIIYHFFTIKIPLGVIRKQETKGDEMIDIVGHVHQYVPMKDGKIQYRVFFGGDQLTVERCRLAQNAKNSVSLS